MARMLGDAFVVVSPDSKGFGPKLTADLKAILKGIEAKVKVVPDVGSRTAVQAKLDTLLKGVTAKVSVVPDLGARTALQSKMDALLKGVTAKIPATLDLGSKAALQAKLDALVKDANAKVPATLDLGSKIGLQAKLDTLTEGVKGKVPVTGDLGSRINLQAKLDSLTAGMKGKIPVTEDLGSAAALQAKLSALAKSAHAKIPVAEDLGSKAALQGKLEALTRGMQSKVRVDAEADKTSFTGVLAKLALLTRDRVMKVVAVVDDAGLLSLSALLFGHGPGGGGGGGSPGIIAGFGYFGRAMGATVGGIKVWHLALDAGLETLIAVGTAAAAAAIGIASVGPAAENVADHMRAVDIVNESLGNQIPSLSRDFDNLAASMAPQVIEGYGGLLDIVNRNTGVLGQTAHQVVDIFDTWIAKLDIWSKSQNSFGGILKTGTGFLQQFGDVMGHVLSAINNLLKADPGTAHVLLTIIDGFAKAVDWVSKLPAPLLETALAMHSFYVWGSVAGAALTRLGGGFGILGRALTTVAKNPVLVALALAAVQIARQWNSSSASVAKSIAGINSAIDSMSASQAFFAIPETIGKINVEISQLNIGSVLKDWHSWGSIFQETGAEARTFGSELKGITQGSFLDELKSTRDVIHSMSPGFLAGKAAAAQMRQDVANLNAEITKLLGSSLNLDTTLGLVMKGALGAGGATYSFSQALAIMNLAGVRANDKLDVMEQKVQNLIAGYQAMSVQGPLLSKSVDAITFATGLQDSKVDQLNSSWDTFIKTITGGASSFATFGTNVEGMYQAAQVGGAHLTDSNGKVSSSFGTLASSATSTKGSFTGLNTTSLALQQTYAQSITDGNAYLDSLTSLAAASGLGAKGTTLMQQATKDMVILLAPAAKGSATLTAQLYALAQRGGYQGADSLKALSGWAGKTKNPMKDLQGITQTFTVAAGNLTKDVQNLSVALGQKLTGAMSQAIFLASGGQKNFVTFATAVKTSGGNMARVQPSANALAKEILNMTHNLPEAKSQFEAFAVGGLGLSRKQADALWNSFIRGGGTMTAAQKKAAEAKTAFEQWAGKGGASGMGLTKKQADSLWDSVGNKGTSLMHALAGGDVPKTKAAFEEWAGKGGKSGMGLTKKQADDLWSSLNTAGGPALVNNAKKAKDARDMIHAFGGSAGDAANQQKQSVPLYKRVWDGIYNNTVGAAIRIGKDIPGGLKHASDWLNNTFGPYVEGFFTKTIPHWFDVAVGAVKSHFVNPIINGWKAASDWLQNTFGPYISGFFTKTIPHWFDVSVGFVRSHFVTPVTSAWKGASDWLQNTFGPYLSGFFTKTLPHWFDIAVGFARSHFVTPVTNAWKGASDWLQNTFAPYLSGFFTRTLPHWFDLAVGFARTHFVTPIISAWKGASDWIQNTFAPYLSGFFTRTLPHWFDLAVGFARTHFTTPVTSAWKGASDWIQNTFAPYLSGFFTRTIPHWFDLAVGFARTHFVTPIISAWKGASDWIQNTFGPYLSNFFTKTLPHWVDVAVNNIGLSWNGIKKKFADPVNFVTQSVINGTLLRGINSVLSFVGIKTIPGIPKITGYAKGGAITGGKRGEDSVLAALMPGEVVVPTSMVDAGAVDHLRGRLPGFASGGYVSPFPNWSPRPERIDQGVDFAGAGPVAAIGKARIGITGGGGWPGGPYMSYQLAEGSHRGAWVYVAENIRPVVKAGQNVNAGQHIANMFNGGTGIETGWGTNASTPLAKVTGGYHEGDKTAAGLDFDKFLISLGVAKAPNFGSQGVVGKVIGGITGFFGGIIRSVEDILSGIGGGFKDFALDLFHGDIGAAIKNILGKKSSAGGAQGEFGQMLTDLPPTLLKKSAGFLTKKIKDYVTGQQAADSSGGGVGPIGNVSGNEKSVITALLKAMGAPGSTANVSSMAKWIARETPWPPVAKYNPMNTTLSEPGATSYNSIGVKNYKSWQQGIAANAQTLLHGYPTILGDLRSGKGIGPNAAHDLLKWSGGGYSHLARGGQIPGFGGGDSVPALLEPGEAVVDKMTARRHAGVLGAIGVPGFASGGLVPSRANLQSEQSKELAQYAGLVKIFHSTQAHPKKGSWYYTNRKLIAGELGTLATRQKAEAAAYARLSGAGLTKSNLSSFGAKVRAELSTARDQALTKGHPEWDAGLRAALNSLNTTSGKAIPAGAVPPPPPDPAKAALAKLLAYDLSAMLPTNLKGTGTYGYANGGPITEPVFGVGLRTGSRYSFGEHGPESVVPGYGGGGNSQINMLLAQLIRETQRNTAAVEQQGTNFARGLNGTLTRGANKGYYGR